MTNATDKFQAQQYLANDGPLANFMPLQQRFALLDMIKGEEADHFVNLVLQTVKRIKATPVTYETESVRSDDKVVHLHYFKGAVDAWIVERDVGDEPFNAKDTPVSCRDPNLGMGEQIQAYGRVNLFGDGFNGQDAEWGYVSIQELIENGVELDLYWEPKTVKELRAK